MWASQLDVLCRLDRVLVMYSPKIDEKQIKRLYHLRERLKAKGEKATMIKMVREAVEKYLKDNEPQKRDTKAGVQLDRTHQ